MMSDEVSIRLKGAGAQTVLKGWQKIRITTGIERVPPDFTLEYTEQAPDGVTSVAVPGQQCTILIGSDPVLTGYVDRVAVSVDEGRHQFTLTGRGMTEDLVDCAAVWQGAIFTNVTALDMATKLAAPYGIIAVTDRTDLARLPLVAMNLGETAYELLDRVCKLSAVLAYERPDGTLFLTRVGDGRAASGFEQGRNVQRATYTSTMDQRFSDYTVVFPGNQMLGDAGESPLTTYNYKDSGVPRYRQKYIELLSNSVMTTLSEKQAMWEMNRRIGQAHEVQVTVDSWRDQAGNLWAINTLADVEIPSIKVSRTQMLIGEVSFLRELDTGTVAELTLMLPQAYDVEPIPYLPIPMDAQDTQGQ